MAGPLFKRDMENIAVERQREGLRLQEQHYERNGLCALCGRLSPCDSYNEGVELASRYAQFLATPEPEPAPPPGNLLRPFVASLGFPNGGRW